MKILRVLYEIHTTCSDQSDFSICYNYDLSMAIAIAGIDTVHVVGLEFTLEGL